MSLSSLGLDAFHGVARAKNFSAAAKNLHITQSALSQRILKLEDELRATLLIRDPKGVRLTEAGEHLLRYCQMRQSIEEVVWDHLLKKKQHAAASLAGTCRIGGYSTVIRSVVIPALGPCISSHPHSRVEIFTRETRDLAGLLRSGEVDLILADREYCLPGMVNEILGWEENVLVEPVRGECRDVFLDHDVDDTTTAEFLKMQPPKLRRPKFERMFLDEIYTILDGVARGWGRAVVPRHLVGDSKLLRVVPGYRPLKIPVVLSFYEQLYYTPLFEEVTKSLRQNAGSYLGA